MEEQKLQKQERQDYHDNDLILARPNGIPLHRERVSSDFKTLLQRIGMPHIRFHDLRHPNVKLKTKIFSMNIS